MRHTIGVGRASVLGGPPLRREWHAQDRAYDATDQAVKIAGEAQDFDWQAEQIKRPQARSADRSAGACRRTRSDERCRYRRAALALDERRRIGVEIGTGAAVSLSRETYEYGSSGRETCERLHIPLRRTADCHRRYRGNGSARPSHVVRGMHQLERCVFFAAEHIALGRQDIMIAGGVDAPLRREYSPGFDLMTGRPTTGTTSRIVLPGP